jgi:hypothetical protein
VCYTHVRYCTGYGSMAFDCGSVMKDYIDMFICLVVYLVGVVVIGGGIGLFLDWL